MPRQINLNAEQLKAMSTGFDTLNAASGGHVTALGNEASRTLPVGSDSFDPAKNFRARFHAAMTQMGARAGIIQTSTQTLRDGLFNLAVDVEDLSDLNNVDAASWVPGS